MSAIRPLFVVAGIGNGSGTGASSARLFGKLGYRVALISRGPEHLNKLANEISQNGGEAAPFSVPDYTPASIRSAFSTIRTQFPVATSPLRVAVFNAGYGVWKPFLDITEEEVRESLDVNVLAASTFSREVLLEFTKNDLEQASEGGKGGSRKKGTLIFTGATASLRGNTTTSVFAAAKFGVRALSQSLAKEFGKQNIHVAHSIIDGTILTDRTKKQRNDPAWESNADVHLDPDSIAKAYLDLVEQDSSAWAWEIDLRPAHEKW
ncbi:NAD(P)-binding protein [Imleria badia]|nr:NAD(P)-binding protein [Imleria badia]